MTETQWTKYLCDKMKKCGVICTPMVQLSDKKRGVYSQKGISDRHVACKAWTGWVEFKNTTTITSHEQCEFMRCQNIVNPISAVVWRKVSDCLDSVALQIYPYCKPTDKPFIVAKWNEILLFHLPTLRKNAIMN